jgi:hypothetical protein
VPVAFGQRAVLESRGCDRVESDREGLLRGRGAVEACESNEWNLLTAPFALEDGAGRELCHKSQLEGDGVPFVRRRRSQSTQPSYQDEQACYQDERH